MFSEDSNVEVRDVAEETAVEVVSDEHCHKYLNDTQLATGKTKKKLFLMLMLIILIFLTLVIVVVALLMKTSPKPDYPTYDQIIQKLNQTVTKMSQHINIRTQLIGQSVEKRDILLLKLSPGTLNSSLAAEPCLHPLVWVVCGVHAREWTSPLICLSFIDKLGDIFVNHTSDEDEDILRTFQFNILVLANPDGYHYSMSLPTRRLARKNRRKSSCPDSSLIGVDINRNFGSGFNHGDDCYGQDCPFNATPSLLANFRIMILQLAA
jgi:hypothetical protein